MHRDRPLDDVARIADDPAADVLVVTNAAIADPTDGTHETSPRIVRWTDTADDERLARAARRVGPRIGLTDTHGPTNKALTCENLTVDVYA